MTRTSRAVLGLTAGLVLAFTASPARACDRHEGFRNRPAPQAVYHPPAAAHIAAGVAFRGPEIAVYAPPASIAVEVGGPAYWHGHRRWQGERRAAELRHDYRELELARRRFYSTWDGNPWRRDRFESWYGTRRAELDGRRAALYG